MTRADRDRAIATIVESDEYREEVWAYHRAVEALNTVQVDDPEPLTMEQLENMVGEAVWIHTSKFKCWASVGSDWGSQMCFYPFRQVEAYAPRKNNYQLTWTAYPYPPKECK